MSVRNASPVAARHVAMGAGNRMSALLAHGGAIVHADHWHRIVSTAFKVVPGSDGAKYNLFEQGDEVWWYDMRGNAHRAQVVRVLDLSPESAGLPEGYQVQIEGDTARIVDTVARKLRIFDPNEEADEAKGLEHVDNSHAIIVRRVASMIHRARAAQAKVAHEARAAHAAHKAQVTAKRPYRIVAKPHPRGGHVVCIVTSH